MQIDIDPLKVQETHLVEPVEIMMVETLMDINKKGEVVRTLDDGKKIKVVYPNP